MGDTNEIFNPDERLFNIDYRNASNIAYLAARLEETWGIDRINLLMHAALSLRLKELNQQEIIRLKELNKEIARTQ